jgi:hypothetical protein
VTPLLIHPGKHAVKPGPVAMFFRRAVAAVRRKPAVPAELPAGAATPTDAEPSAVSPEHVGFMRWVDLSEHDLLSDTEIAALRPRFTPARPVFTPSDAMTTGEFKALDAKVDVLLRGEHPYPPLQRDREMAAEADRAEYVRSHVADCQRGPDMDTLQRVLDGLKVYGQAPQLAIEAQRLEDVMLP